MSVFQDILNLLTASPGGMVYYLILLFSIWTIVGLALTRWQRQERKGVVARLLVAGALMSVGRLTFFVLGLLDRSTIDPSLNYLLLLGPPLERFLDATSLILICWALVIPSRRRTLGRAFLGITLLIALATYIILAMQWSSALQIDPGAMYNLSWQRWIWELGQLLLLSAAIVYLFVERVDEQGTILIALSLLAVGHLLQAVVPLADQIPHFAGWVRFAQLLAFPLFAVIAFRLIVHRFDAEVQQLQAVNQDSLTQITGLMDLLDTNQKMSLSLDKEIVLTNAIHSISQTLESNLCALALVDQDDPDVVHVSVLYRTPDTLIDQDQIQIDEYPAVQHAITRKKPVLFEAGENGHSAQVYELMGSEQNGPLIVQPLLIEDDVIGIILVGRPGQSAAFKPIQVRKCATLARHIAPIVRNALAFQRMRVHMRAQSTKLDTFRTEYARTRADLENRLQQSQDEIALYVQKLYDTELAEQQAQKDAQELRQKLKKAPTDQEIVELETRRAKLEQRVQELERENQDLQAKLSKAANSFTALRERMRQFENSLAEQEEPHAQALDVRALDHLSFGLILFDRQDRIHYVNPVASHLLDWIETAPHRELAALWSDPDWTSAVHALKSQPADQAEPLVLSRTADKVQITMSPMHEQDQYVGTMLVIQDQHLVDDRTRARDEFLASLAQELRTPMTSILGYTDLLMNESVGALEGIQRKFLQRVQANIERMEAMLNDLIGVTAIDSGNLIIELEPVDVTRAIESALRKAQFRLEERELNTEIEIDDLPLLYADPEHVQQIIDNLVTNACTASITGTTIHITAQQEDTQTGRSHLHLSVSDTGGGIASQDQVRVFERFYRADNALIAGLGETGVGLSIVKALVEAHRGHVWIETQMGEGTTFHVTLPFGLERDSGVNNTIVTERQNSGDNGHGE
jgi:signal transduction histidine kinase